MGQRPARWLETGPSTHASAPPARVLPLLLLLLLLGPASPGARGWRCHPPSPGPASWSGRATRGGLRRAASASTRPSGEDGRPRGVVAYLDPAAHLRMRAETHRPAGGRRRGRDAGRVGATLAGEGRLPLPAGPCVSGAATTPTISPSTCQRPGLPGLPGRCLPRRPRRAADRRRRDAAGRDRDPDALEPRSDQDADRRTERDADPQSDARPARPRRPRPRPGRSRRARPRTRTPPHSPTATATPTRTATSAPTGTPTRTATPGGPTATRTAS